MKVELTRQKGQRVTRTVVEVTRTEAEWMVARGMARVLDEAPAKTLGVAEPIPPPKTPARRKSADTEDMGLPAPARVPGNPGPKKPRARRTGAPTKADQASA